MSWLSNLGTFVGNALSSVPIPGLSGFGSAISSIASKSEARDQLAEERAWASREAQLNREFQTSERLASQDWNLEMWNRENEYNSPANQIRLAMEAGINPNSVVNKGGFVPTSAPTTSAQSGSMASSPGSLANSILTQDVQTSLMMSQARKTLAEAKGQEIDNNFAPVIRQTEIDKMIAEINEIGTKKGFTEEQTKQLKDLFPLLKGKNEQELEEMKEKVKQAIENTRKLKADADSAEYQAWQEEQNKIFRDTFGVAPGSGLIDGLIQLIGSGEKGANIAEALVDTLFSLATGSLSAVGNAIFSRFPKWLHKQFEENLVK